ncbi:DinB family protein [Chloroflexi bacterium TSY]|nr:DinB family protein [Chloroflexi bacterium TSY]
MSYSLPILRHTRNSIYKAVKDLTPRQCLTVPDGHDNNVAWNLGHIIAVQQRICYLRSGLDAYVSDEMTAMYLPGTSPADWEIEPDTEELVALLMDHQEKIEADYAAGKFGGTFEEMKTTSGLHVPDFETALIFNIYHESQHFGMILALNNFVAR